MKLSQRLDRAIFLIADSLKSHTKGKISKFDAACVGEYLFVIKLLLDLKKRRET